MARKHHFRLEADWPLTARILQGHLFSASGAGDWPPWSRESKPQPVTTIRFISLCFWLRKLLMLRVHNLVNAKLELTGALPDWHSWHKMLGPNCYGG